MKIHRIALALASLCSGAAWASTDCTAPVASITVETGNERAGYIVSLEGGVSFAMLPKARNYSEVLGMVYRSQMMTENLTVRFAATGVDCKQAARRTDLIAVVYAGNQTQTMTTTTPAAPPSATVTTPSPPTRP